PQLRLSPLPHPPREPWPDGGAPPLFRRRTLVLFLVEPLVPTLRRLGPETGPRKSPHRRLRPVPLPESLLPRTSCRTPSRGDFEKRLPHLFSRTGPMGAVLPRLR